MNFEDKDFNFFRMWKPSWVLLPIYFVFHKIDSTIAIQNEYCLHMLCKVYTLSKEHVKRFTSVYRK